MILAAVLAWAAGVVAGVVAGGALALYLAASSQAATLAKCLLSLEEDGAIIFASNDARDRIVEMART